jgi:hypothetical protein
MRPSFRKTAPTVLLSASLLSVMACGKDEAIADPTIDPPGQGIVAGTLAVSAARPNLTLRNTTASVVGYMVVDKDMAVLAVFPPCTTQCPTLIQGASATVPYSSIAGYTTSSTEAIVMWWTYIRAADGTLQATGGVQSAKITL